MKPRVNPDVTDLEIITDPVPAKKNVRHRQWGGTTVGLLVGLAVLALGRTGHLWPEMDVAAQFGAQAICVVCGFAIAAFLPRFKALAGLVLTGLFILAYGMWPVVASQTLNKGPFELGPGERPMRLVQFNVWSENSDAQAVAREIERLDADVVGLEELEVSKREILFRLRTAYPFQYACNEVPGCEFAILSRVPILAASSSTEQDNIPHISVRLGGRLEGVTVFAVHTLRFPYSRKQMGQVRSLVKRLETETGHVIVGGDFNATPFSRVVDLLAQSSGMKRLTSMPSWPSWMLLPQMAIDHVFVSGSIRPLAQAQIGQPAGSDHYPVVVNIAIPKN